MKLEQRQCKSVDVTGQYGATENARHEFAAPTCKGAKCGTKLQGWKMREKLVWKAEV